MIVKVVKQNIQWKFAESPEMANDNENISYKRGCVGFTHLMHK